MKTNATYFVNAEKQKFLFENAREFYGFNDLSELEEIKNML